MRIWFKTSLKRHVFLIQSYLNFYLISLRLNKNVCLTDFLDKLIYPNLFILQINIYSNISLITKQN